MPSLPAPAAFQEETAHGGALPRQRSTTDDMVVTILEKPSGVVRGPWDHSGSIGVAIDIDKLLAPMARAMVVVR